MPSPSAIWVCDSPNCWRMRRKRGPTNNFFPESLGIAVPLQPLVVIPGRAKHELRCAIAHLRSGPEPVIGPRFARTRWDHPGMTPIFVTKFTKLHLLQVVMLHHITIR